MNLICVEDGIDSSKDSGKLMIYVLSAVTEIEGLEKQYRQLTGAKARIGQQMDSLDIMDKFYEKKYQDMETRLESPAEYLATENIRRKRLSISFGF